MFKPSWAVSRCWRTLLAVVLLGTAAGAAAQSTDAMVDPPDRVARLSYLSGDVGVLPAGAQDWSDASINRPLTRGDRLATDRDARAELELDGATLRIDGHTDFGFLELGDQLAQVELTQGTLGITVRRLAAGQSYEIDTPTVALVIDQPGSFRIDIDEDGRTTHVTARDGDATVYGENQAERRILAGRSYRFDDSSLNAVLLTEIDGGDDFDAWSADRDRRYTDDSPSRQYVSDEVIGYQDLDRYGDWRSDPDYGRVWYPRQVDADWAPYRDGHWAYIAPWGWTWVDDSPWGFAPYHYGRWAFAGGGWCWVPGPVAVRPVYAPALVVFIGGSGWTLSMGSAPVGWFPLGPGEIYDPWYRGSRHYFTQVNITNIRYSRHHRRDEVEHGLHRHYDRYRRGLPPPVRAEHYAHRDARSVTAVSGRRFADAQPVRRHRLRIDPKQLHNAPVLGRAGTPRPTPRSMGEPRRQGRALPTAGFERAVVSRHAPPSIPGVRRVAYAGARPAQPSRNVQHAAERRAALTEPVRSPERTPRPARPVARTERDPARAQAYHPLRSAGFAPGSSGEREPAPRPRMARALDSAEARAPRGSVSYIAPAERERAAPTPMTRAPRAGLPAVPQIRSVPSRYRPRAATPAARAQVMHAPRPQVLPRPEPRSELVTGGGERRPAPIFHSREAAPAAPRRVQPAPEPRRRAATATPPPVRPADRHQQRGRPQEVEARRDDRWRH